MEHGQVIAYFDGLCEPRNPGGLACGGFVVEPHDCTGWNPVTGHRYFCRGAGATNNVAEYNAALLALTAIWRLGWRGPVVLRGDSQLVVRQFNGEYACNALPLVPLLARLRKASECFESLTLEWIAREGNEAADAESRAAYREETGKEPPVRTKARTRR